MAITFNETYNETMRRATTHSVTGSSDSYVQSLLPGIAALSNVTNSRINNIAAMENPNDGQSCIYTSVVNAHFRNIFLF